MKRKSVLWLLVVSVLILVSLLFVACAKPAPAPAPKPAPAPAPAPPPAPAPKPVVGVPAIAHTLEGRADCLACHQTGVGGAKKIPADHAGRTNETCTTCHKPAK